MPRDRQASFVLHRVLSSPVSRHQVPHYLSLSDKSVTYTPVLRQGGGREQTCFVKRALRHRIWAAVPEEGMPSPRSISFTRRTCPRLRRGFWFIAVTKDPDSGRRLARGAEQRWRQINAFPLLRSAFFAPRRVAAASPTLDAGATRRAVAIGGAGAHSGAVAGEAGWRSATDIPRSGLNLRA